MAKEKPAAEEAPPAEAGTPAPSKGLSAKKLILIGLPIFLVQLAILFFVATKLVGNSNQAAPTGPAEPPPPAAAEEGPEAAAQRLFVVKDLIVNPAGTNGTRFLLLTVGFETSSGAAGKELEAKEIQVRDILNTVLTAKNLQDLASVTRRDELRGEIQTRVGALLKVGSVSSVYFSKFIIQ